MSDVDDGRNPEWPPGSVVLDLWEAMIAHGPLSGPSVGRPRLALGTLDDADDLLALARDAGSSRDAIAAYAGVRAARKAASDLVHEFDPPARRGATREARSRRKPTDHRRHRTNRAMSTEEDDGWRSIRPPTAARARDQCGRIPLRRVRQARPRLHRD